MSEWIDVNDRLPDPGLAVLMSIASSIGKRRTLVGHYMTEFTWESSPESDLDIRYDEERDAYFDPSGWYAHCEWHPDFAYCLLDTPDEPTHWMPLPEPPR